MFLLDVLEHQFLVQFSNLFPIYFQFIYFIIYFPIFSLNKASQGCTGNRCWEMHLVQGTAKFPQHIGVAATDWGIN